MSNFAIHIDLPNGRCVQVLWPTVPLVGDSVELSRNDESGVMDTFKVINRTFVQNGGIYIQVRPVLAPELIVNDE